MKIVFIIGMHRCGTSVLTNCLIENGFSIGKNKNTDKNWQNPNGYFENDTFTKFHEKLLKFNSSTWLKINKNKMEYTLNHVIEYRKLLEKEFIQNNLIIIKDPRLTFFVDFIKEVCNEKYEPYFLFLLRNKKECIQSLSKAQNISVEECSILYDNTMQKYNDKFLKIDHHDIIFNNNNVIEQIYNFLNLQNYKKTEHIINMELYRNKYIV